MPHLSIGVDYFLIGAESFMTSVTQRPITIRHVATAKTQNSTIFYITWLKSTMHTVGTSRTCAWALADNGNLQVIRSCLFTPSYICSRNLACSWLSNCIYLRLVRKTRSLYFVHNNLTMILFILLNLQGEVHSTFKKLLWWQICGIQGTIIELQLFNPTFILKKYQNYNQISK